VFLFDEPLSNLDAVLRGEMRREIARLHRASRTTSLYVTHDQVEAMTLADRIAVLRDGHLQQVGTPMEIYDAPANRFVAGFFGAPAMCFLRAEIGGDTDRAVARGAGFALPLARPALDRGDVWLGIRPEAVRLEPGPGATAVAARVATREVLGAEVVLYLASPAGDLTARAAARHPARPGDHLTVYVDPHAVHVFDGRSELRL